MKKEQFRGVMPPPRHIQQVKKRQNVKKEQFRGVMPPPRYIQQVKKKDSPTFFGNPSLCGWVMGGSKD